MNLLNIGLGAAGIIVTNYAIKFGKAAPLIKKAYILIKNQEEARRDKVLTVKEKARLYDDIENLIKTAWSIIRGVFPNK